VPANLDPQAPAPVQIWGTVDEIVLITTPDHVITYASPGTLPVLGYTPSQVIGTSVRGYLHPDDDDPMSRLAAASPDGGKGWVHRVRRRTGGYVWLRTRGQVVRDAEGRPQEIVSMSRDITGQVEAERRLASTEARFRWAFDQAPVGMALSGFDGVLQRANKALADLLGTTPEELVGAKIADITHPDDRERDEVNALRLAAGVDTMQHVVKRYVDARGRIIPVQVWARTLVVAHVMALDGSIPGSGPSSRSTRGLGQEPEGHQPVR
jgi:PAS domain S-box-containing protein